MLLSQLTYLVALAKERHFARAAQACFVSQPALSAAISKLENEFRVPIVKRSNRFIGFTPEGERIVRWAQRVLADHDALVDDVKAMREGLSGRLRLGAMPTTLSSISLVTRPFCEENPLVGVSIRSMSSAGIHRSLAAFQIDAGLTYLDNEPLGNVRSRPLYRERYVLLTSSRDGPFSGRETLTWAEAAELPLCLLSPEMQNRRIIDEAFRRAGAAPEPVVETDSVSALWAHVREGLWSAVMSHAWLYPHPVPEGMRAIPLVEPEVGRTIGLVVANRDPEPLLVRAFLDTVGGIDVEGRLAGRHPADPPARVPRQRGGAEGR
ncbi:LysR family transcriptional regulator [Nocardiopsis flavescens]|uniref:LysR family transcriptional regulator n=1 Tax=Nocardiopsis flavescens TaxID=758803 RepID=UPI00364E2E1D